MSLPSLSGKPHLLVGRERELVLLRQHFEAALAGQGSIVLVSGEAGAGKTSVAEAICREATDRGARVLVGRCFDIAETPAYGPFLYLFERYHHGDGPPPPGTFSLPGIVGDVTGQSALFRQVLDFLKTLTTQVPAILFLDDAQWFDPASLDLLRYLAQSVATIPLLLLVACRADELAPTHPLAPLLPALVRETDAARIDLHPLTVDAVHVLVQARYHLSDTDTDRLVAYLNQRAEGNALFVGELLRSLEETSLLRQTSDRWTLGPLSDAEVPPLLRQMIATRVARLGAVAQRLLGLASVVGQEVRYDLWIAVADADERQLLDVVAEAAAAHMMAENRDGSGANFAHALIREALYESVRPSQRRQWHRMTGEVLAASPDADPDAVASHFLRAGDNRAVVWLVRAGDRAQRAWAWVTAAERYTRAHTLLRERGEDTLTQGWLLVRLALLQRIEQPARGVASLEESAQLVEETGDQMLAATVAFLTGMMHCYASDVQRGLTELRAGAQALDALDALPDAEWAHVRAFDPFGVLVGPSGRWGIVAFWLATIGRYAEAGAVCESVAYPDAVRAADVFVHRSRAMVAAAIGQPGEAEQAYRRALASARVTGNQHWIGTTALRCLEEYGVPYRADDSRFLHELLAASGPTWLPAESGLPDEGLPGIGVRLSLLLLAGQWDEVQEVAAGLAASGSDALGRRMSLCHVLGTLAHWRGETDHGWQLVSMALRHGTETEPGTTPFIHTLPMLRLAALLALDTHDQMVARDWLRAHDRWLAWSGGTIGRSEGEALWAQHDRQTGDLPRTYEHAQYALAHASAPRQPLALLAAHRLLADLDIEMGQFAEARVHLDAALALADTCAAPFERALTLLAQADLELATNGKGTEQLLDTVERICLPLGAAPTLARCAALRVRHTTRAGAPSAYPAGLSIREVEVLRLLAAGRTNRDIAAALFLSERTVNKHVTHILTKTATDNRTAAAAFAHRNGIG